MTNSQNGWPINPADRSPLTVAGVPFGDVRDGDVFTVLKYVATRFHNEVEHLIAGTCGAYNPRKIPGSDTWSNHASATAIDCNWQRHPLGARGTYTAAQRTAIGRIIDACDGVVRWGGVYTTTVDEMHFEINKGAAAVKALAAKIRNEEDDVATQDMIDAAAQGLRNVIADGNYAAKNADGTQPQNFIRDALRNIVGGPVDQAAILAAINAHDDVDEQALAAALVPSLTNAIVAALPAGALTGADVETAVRNVLRSGVGAE